MSHRMHNVITNFRTLTLGLGGSTCSSSSDTREVCPAREVMRLYTRIRSPMPLHKVCWPQHDSAVCPGCCRFAGTILAPLQVQSEGKKGIPSAMQGRRPMPAQLHSSGHPSGPC